MLLQRFERKSFLHRIVAGDGKWIYFENPKRKKSWLSPGEFGPSTPRPNRFGRNTMLCVWWDQCGVVYFELLRPGETVNTDRYRQQIINLNHALIEKRPEWARRHGNIIAPALLSRPRPVRLSAFRIDGTLTRRAALRQFCRSRKMARLMVCLEREKVFLEWYPWFARKMDKMCRIQWSILWINFF